ncbi:MAG: hypothetical protein WBF93_01625, partial [Pirellulales bacterium]
MPADGEPVHVALWVDGRIKADDIYRQGSCHYRPILSPYDFDALPETCHSNTLSASKANRQDDIMHINVKFTID